MKALIVEDDITCRMILQRLLEPFGHCDIAADGKEGIVAFQMGLDAQEPYDLICLDIMMPGMDGHEALQEIRRIEEEAGVKGLDAVKVIMVTALGDAKTIMRAFNAQCEAYLVKPIDKSKLMRHLREMKLIAE